jgi:phosphatidylserine decarboxylase
MSVIDQLLTLPQYVAPHHGLSRLAGRIARIRHPGVRTFLIRSFLALYRVDLSEAERSSIHDYASFNDFFTRALRPHARPLAHDPAALISPADGAISQIGTLDGDRLLQAKGRDYSLAALLALDTAAAARYAGGNFLTVYLAPHNYHRVHAPFGGRITAIRYVPGQLFSVNQRTARCVDRLFARNERVVVEFETERGRIAVILVGAMLVASMELTVCDLPAETRAVVNGSASCDVPAGSDFGRLERGEELGRFNMGSTVIIVGEAARWQWLPELHAGSPLRMGEALTA